MITNIKLTYYSGNFALGCDPTPGNWDGDTFTAADGSKWKADPNEDEDDPHPTTDGTDTHYLVPAHDTTTPATGCPGDQADALVCNCD